MTRQPKHKPKPKGLHLPKNFANPTPGEGYIINNILLPDTIEDIPPSPPTPPSPRPCLYEDPATRETIRRNLKDLTITNINQLLRTYDAATLLEAISDYQRAQKSRMRILSPTGYFKTLLK